MNNVLTPAYPPLSVPGLKSWADVYKSLSLIATEIIIVTGYCSETSIKELLQDLKSRPATSPKLKSFDFILGMAFFEGLTEKQMRTLRLLDKELQKSKLGRVRIPTSIKVHTKCSIFKVGKSWTGTLGSSNFSAVVPTRQSEVDILISDGQPELDDLKSYTLALKLASVPLSEALIRLIPILKPELTLLARAPEVTRSSLAGSNLRKTGRTFELPLKSESKSNLNKFNSQPRGSVRRPWWEIEIIVPATTQKLQGFPNRVDDTNRFTVITDDGFVFDCHVSGGEKPRSNKNFESSKRLSIFGYWLKGRMVESGALEEGDPVTDVTLSNFGFSRLLMHELSKKNTWYIEFAK